MRKFTLFLMSLFLTVGAMAQTFVEPVTGKYYKIKGDSQSLPWVTANTNSSGSVAVSANEADAAVFEKTANGFKAVSTGKYLGYTGGKFGYSATEITVELVNTGSQANNQGKYAIRSGGNWMYNNNTDGIVHESSAWLDLERLWGFIEVTDMPVLISRTGGGVTASSQETSGDPGQATNAIDGNNSTFWHTVYAETYPHWIEFDMQNSYTVYSFDYVSRFDNTNSNGNILNYKLYISNSAMNGSYENATLAASGTFEYGKGVNHLIELASPVAGRYVALVAESGTRGNWSGNAAANAANCAEFNVYGIEVPAETNEAAKAALAEKIAQAEALLATITIGDGVGEYSCGGYTEAEVESLLGSAKGFYDSITSDTEVASIEAYIEFINETIAMCSLNMPVAGKYYRFYCAAGQRYLASDISNNRLEMQTTDKNIEDQIFLCAQNGDGLAIVSYSKGQAINAYNLDDIATMSAAVFSATYNNVYSQYNIKVGNRYIYGQGNTQNNHIDSGEGDPNSNGYNWVIEEVTSLPVTITTAKYATFYAPVAVNVPNNVTAHTVTINGEWATLSEALTVIPANTGVVLYADVEEATTYNFDITENVDAIEGNALRGSAAATYYTETGTYYALALDDTAKAGVAFCKDEFKNNRFQNNSHKAYLYIPGVSGSASLRFDFGGTTAVEEVETEVAETVIYDLTGRRVNEITKAGVYVVNGKKILVK